MGCHTKKLFISYWNSTKKRRGIRTLIQRNSGQNYHHVNDDSTASLPTSQEIQARPMEFMGTLVCKVKSLGSNPE